MLNIALFNQNGEKLNDLELNENVFGIEPNNQAIFDVVLLQRASLRQGTHKVKNRHEVSGGGKKPWRQKGTGRARQGSIRAPQWRGGGIVFGPTPRSYDFKINKKVKNLALRSVLSQKVIDQELVALDNLAFDTIKTKNVVNFLGNFENPRKTLIVVDTLEENLQLIANALGGKGTPREVLRNYFLNDFFKDHCNTYQVTGSGKRPIYWLFDSGKKNGFKALVYIHRYTPDLIARMRTGYIHPQQARYRTQIEMLQGQIHDASNSSEKVKLSKQFKKINEQLLELNKYEEVIHHWADKMEPMDLDDGVKVNYAKFQELLAKIK